jgi:AcrR family transcriptional regulator
LQSIGLTAAAWTAMRICPAPACGSGRSPVPSTDGTQQLGITPPSLYAAFGDKRTLFVEAVDVYYARFVGFLDATLGASGSARDAITALLRGIAAYYSDPDQPRGCLVNTTPPPAGDSETRAYLQSLRDGVRDRLRRRILIGAEAGELPAGTDVDELAELYWNTILGMSMRSRDGATRGELERTAEVIMITWPSPDKSS